MSGAANKIKKVEYYEDPPIRYGDVGILMNIITKPLDTGYTTGFDVSNALTTGFSDDNVYFKYNKGNHQFSFDYSINVRNYRDWIEDNQYSFTLDNQTGWSLPSAQTFWLYRQQVQPEVCLQQAR